MGAEEETSLSGGVYDVNEYGINFRHQPGPPTPRDGDEYLSRLKKNFSMRILEHPHPNELVFEMVNIDMSLANALRRIMIAEVPSVAIETVHMWNNTSIVHDEVLSHRLGLVPLDVDPRYLDDFEDEEDEEDGDDEEGGNKEHELTERNTVVFRMKVECKRPKKNKNKNNNNMDEDEEEEDNNNNNNSSISGHAAADTVAQQTAKDLLQKRYNTNNTTTIPPPSTRPYTKHVYSHELQWVPQGSQAETMFAADRLPRPLHHDILLAKLRPGQHIELEAHAVRGLGRDHAKFSPVATACYRLAVGVELLRPVYDEAAEALDVYEPGVFKLVPCTDSTELSSGHRTKAVVDNPYACTMSRNYMRDPVLKESVKMTRLPNHFIFSVESVGMMPASVVLAESLRVLKTKCEKLVRLVDEYTEGEGMIT